MVKPPPGLLHWTHKGGMPHDNRTACGPKAERARPLPGGPGGEAGRVPAVHLQVGVRQRPAGGGEAGGPQPPVRRVRGVAAGRGGGSRPGGPGAGQGAVGPGGRDRRPVRAKAPAVRAPEGGGEDVRRHGGGVLMPGALGLLPEAGGPDPELLLSANRHHPGGDRGKQPDRRRLRPGGGAPAGAERRHRRLRHDAGRRGPLRQPGLFPGPRRAQKLCGGHDGGVLRQEGERLPGPCRPGGAEGGPEVHGGFEVRPGGGHRHQRGLPLSRRDPADPGAGPLYGALWPDLPGGPGGLCPGL